MKRLTIIVPYRAREPHLRQFIPHLKAFFSRDKVHRHISYRVLIVEQEQGLPFNLGALRNIGFALTCKDGDYTCFHDVDYLPLSADYSWTDVPTSIAWYGADGRPIIPGKGPWHVPIGPHSFFGAVLLTPNDLFTQVNGYSNMYWGWGREDADLRTRYVAAGITLGRRTGTFLPLDHADRGFTSDGKPAPISAVNRRIYDDKWAAGGRTSGDGLSNLQYEILDRREIDITVDRERPAPWDIVKVRLDMRPLPEQSEALDTDARPPVLAFSYGWPTNPFLRPRVGSVDHPERIVPDLIRLELSSFCQLRCPSCPTTSGAIYPTIGRGFLRFNDFRDLLKRHPYLRRIELSNYGEAFLNPQLLQILEYACERGVAINIANGANLNTAKQEVLEGLVRFGVRALTCSIDGATTETYAKYRVNGRLEAVLDNIQRINGFKKLYKSEFPRLTWQFIIFGHNETEISAARSMARDLDMEFVAKLSWDTELSPVRDPAFVRAQTRQSAVTREEHERLNGVKYLDRICHQLWDNPQINWDGKVLGCCRNFWGEFGGNAFADGLVAVVNSEKMQYARAMLQGRAAPRGDIPCTTCEMYHAMRDRSEYLKRETR